MKTSCIVGIVGPGSRETAWFFSNRAVPVMPLSPWQWRIDYCIYIYRGLEVVHSCNRSMHYLHQWWFTSISRNEVVSCDYVVIVQQLLKLYKCISEGAPNLQRFPRITGSFTSAFAVSAPSISQWKLCRRKTIRQSSAAVEWSRCAVVKETLGWVCCPAFYCSICGWRKDLTKLSYSNNLKTWHDRASCGTCATWNYALFSLILLVVENSLPPTWAISFWISQFLNGGPTTPIVALITVSCSPFEHDDRGPIGVGFIARTFVSHAILVAMPCLHYQFLHDLHLSFLKMQKQEHPRQVYHHLRCGPSVLRTFLQVSIMLVCLRHSLKTAVEEGCQESVSASRVSGGLWNRALLGASVVQYATLVRPVECISRPWLQKGCFQLPQDFV